MQVGAVNSTNFKGLRIQEADFDDAFGNSRLRDKINKFEAKVDKIKSNVRPETCLLTVGAIILSVVKGKKIADYAVKGGVLVKSLLHAGLKKAGGSVAALVKGIAKKDFDKQAYLNNVQTATKKIFRNGIDQAKNIGEPDGKFVEGVEECVNVFFNKDEKTGNKVSKFITDTMGINSKGGILKAAIAGVFGWKAGDGSGDALENMLDNKEIKKEYEKIFEQSAA